MGGRGSSFGAETIQAIGSSNNKDHTVEPLIVAGMTPTDKGSRYTEEVKTLNFIEEKKRNYTKEQLQVIDEHGYVTRAFQGDEHLVGVDSNTRFYMKDKVVTHNHPDAYGGTFSEADISMLGAGMKELRASAKEGTYSMRATERAKPNEFHKKYLEDSFRMQSQMKKISQEMAQKKWGSYEAFRKANRKKQLAVIDNWYKSNANKYGFEYSFKPN